MRTVVSMGIAVCVLMAVLPSVAEPQSPPADPVLVRLRTSLERELSYLKPQATYELPESADGKSLVVRYRTKEYLVYARAKTGRLSATLERREGPEYDGVLIRAHVQPAGQVNQAVVPVLVNILKRVPRPGNGEAGVPRCLVPGSRGSAPGAADQTSGRASRGRGHVTLTAGRCLVKGYLLLAAALIAAAASYGLAAAAARCPSRNSWSCRGGCKDR
jgi:hypothetical protein